MRTQRKILSLLLVLCMVLTFLPTAAFAAGGSGVENDPYTVSSDTELISALGSIENEGYITLSGDIAANITIDSGKTIHLDLNGHELSNKENEHTIINNGTLYITDTPLSRAVGTVDNTSHQKAAIYNNGTAYLNGGSYIRSQEAGKSPSDHGGNSYYVILNHGTMTVKNVTVAADGKHSSLIENGWYDGNKNTSQAPSTLTIISGTFSGGLNTIKNDDYGDLTIQDGTFQNYAQACLLNWNVAEVSGGTFTNDESASCAVILNGHIDDTMDQGQLKITGGTFTGTYIVERMGGSGSDGVGTVEISGGDFAASSAVVNEGVNTGKGSIQISGGTYTGTVPTEQYLDATVTTETDENGQTVVKPLDANTAVAEAGGKYYSSLAAAVEAAKTGETITVLRDGIALDSLVSISDGRNITLDLNEKTVNASKAINLTHGELTVQNGTIKGSQPFNVMGSGTDVANYSVLNIASNATIEATYGICMFTHDYNYPQQSYKSYGAVVNLEGTIKSTDGVGIFVNGLLGNSQDAASAISSAANKYTINIKSGAKIEAAGQGIAMNGYAVVNVADRASITGREAIGVKRGELNISGGTFTATGAKVDNVQANNNGTEKTGAAISITSTYNYAGEIKVNITGGEFKSTHNSALFVSHSTKNNDNVAYEQGVTVSVSGGNFTAPENEAAVYVAPAIDNDNTGYTNKVISGGTFSSEVPNDYCAEGYVPEQDESGNYTVKVDTDTNEAMIGTKVYKTLKDAINHAQTNDEITLLKNITVNADDSLADYDGAITIQGKSVTINGNNYAITAGTGFKMNASGTRGEPHLINILDDSDVTIKDLTIVGKGAGDDSTPCRSGINIYSSDSNSQAKVVLDNVTVQSCSTYGVTSAGSSLTIKSITTSGNSWGGVNVDNRNNASTTSTFIMKAGTIDEENSVYFENQNAVGQTTASITGGTFKNVTVADAAETASTELTITGGSYGNDVSKYVPEGYNQNQDGLVSADICVTNVSLNESSLELALGASEQLVHTITPENATNQNVTWTSSDETVATVTDGLVTAVSEGTATITVTTEDGSKEATCTVTVNPATVAVDGVTLNKTSLTLNVSGTEQLTATVIPENATNKTVTWTSSDEAVATVTEGLVTAVSEGTATITVTTADGSKEATCIVTVSPVTPGPEPDPVYYNVTFTSDHGTQYAPRSVESGKTTELPEQSDPDYSFQGWKAPDNVTYSAGTAYTITADTAFIAQWTPKPVTEDKVTAYFDSNGHGTAPDSVRVDRGTSITLPRMPNDGYYIHTGWSVGEYSFRVNSAYTLNDNTTFVAIWTYDRPSSGGGSSGGSGSSSYAVSTPKSDNGSVSVSPKNAKKGDTVTITVKPSKGYELDELTVTDKNGNELKLKAKGDNQYTFTMPAGKVTVEAAFSKIVEKPTTPSINFTDVRSGDWFMTAVEYVVTNGMMAGTSSDSFSPDKTLTRGMLAQVLYNFDEDSRSGMAGLFSDVISGQWYADAVNWTAARGIMSGYGDTFGPEDPITREQLAVTLFNYSGIKGYDLSGRTSLTRFPDADQTSSWAVSAMEWAVGNGLFAGKDGFLAPRGNATRAEVASVLMNFCENIAV